MSLSARVIRGGCLGAFAIAALLAPAVAVVFSVRSSRALAHLDVDRMLRENAQLRARQDALRERAFDLAEQLYGRVERGRRMLRLTGTAQHASEGQCIRPLARDAGDEVLLAWLSEQGARLEAIGNELASTRAEIGVRRASASVSAARGRATARDGQRRDGEARAGVAAPSGAGMAHAAPR